jgi:hypothetical protein
MRYLKKIAAKIAALIKVVKFLFSVYMGAKRGKEKEMVAGVAIFRGGNWLVIFVTGFLVALLVKMGLSYMPIFLILWIGNMVLSIGIIKANEKTGVDFTSMEGARNLLEETKKISLILGYLVETWMFLFLLCFSGPDQFVIFFEEKFSSNKSKWFILGLASFTYMTIWTLILVGIADGFWDLISKIF